jgi:hypothetical protein
MTRRLNHPALRLACLAALVALTGCSSFRTEMGRPLPAPKQLVEGQTHVDAVVHELGPPHQASRLAEGFVFLYEYSRISEFQLGLSMNLPVIRWFKFLRAWNHLDEQTLALTFDQQGVLRSKGSGNWQESLGGGGGAQLLFVVMSFSDVSELMQPAPAHSWGTTRLQPAPVALNAAQSLRTGEHGLEQRIAPAYVGQHTLEMPMPKTEKEKKRLKKNYLWPR